MRPPGEGAAYATAQGCREVAGGTLGLRVTASTNGQLRGVSCRRAKRKQEGYEEMGPGHQEDRSPEKAGFRQPWVVLGCRDDKNPSEISTWPCPAWWRKMVITGDNRYRRG
jgi:hypothetical protein